MELESILNENTTEVICKYYAKIKAYQYILHKFFTSSNKSNTTIVSIMYLLQSAGESLQTIEVNICLHATYIHSSYNMIITVQQ